MALRYALLAALHESPATGYELTQRFRSRLANVWNASHQQVYRELGKLLEEGKLLAESVPQPDKPDKKRYHLTVAGQKDLKQWLDKPQPRPPAKDPFLVKLFAGNLADKAVLQGEAEKMREEWERQLAYYRSIEEEYFQQPDALPAHYRYQYLALRRGITQVIASLEWLDELENGL
ncbi:PadR family transcriptional regulator [Marinobacter nanhaiticus D15-8W]|uniref:PadR family transcriptional regulator n=1 Tax=Marinobacter nanhaiticus D15-8W TaxID=626887 RepID=N6VV90_9GAMM|nr:PadR family transcriptional regulator [Marinobacter nanhaiticus]ENO14105.1 PadR family transcriptional regulator [Marinobacter nanhaiticus D15-8W]BES71486.1 PadR family transcriptional regulator [Marinobacter nanhaiticus D15-8W]